MDSAAKRTCNICFNKNENKISLAKEMMLGREDNFEYVECSNCKCLQLSEVPENLHEYYPRDGYYSFNSRQLKKFNGINGLIKRKAVHAHVLPMSNLDWIFKALTKQSDVYFLNKFVKNKTDRILDVGCGDGLKFLYPLKEAGFRNVSGLRSFYSRKFEI